jgi:hypothetical protein
MGRRCNGQFCRHFATNGFLLDPAPDQEILFGEAQYLTVTGQRIRNIDLVDTPKLGLWQWNDPYFPVRYYDLVVFWTHVVAQCVTCVDPYKWYVIGEVIWYVRTDFGIPEEKLRRLCESERVRRLGVTQNDLLEAYEKNARTRLSIVHERTRYGLGQCKYVDFRKYRTKQRCNDATQVMEGQEPVPCSF